MLDILTTVENWLEKSQQVALATVVQTWGSSPRQAGAKMGITTDMGMIGSVSGGCVEGAVVGEAIDGLADKKPRLLNFGVADETAWEVGLACGGKISIFVQPLDLTWWRIAADHVQNDLVLATATVINGENAGASVAADRDGVLYESSALSESIRATLIQAASTALDAGKSQRLSENGLDIFVDIYQPRPRLILIGGAHIAMSLKQMAVMLGFRVFLIDPRRAFATPERFPDVESISHEYPDKAMAKIGVTHETYIAVLTHDPKIDDPALRFALFSPAPYIGVFSGKKSHEDRIVRLTKAGIDPALFSRIRTPIGIDIGAKSPEEIALCVMAEIIAVKNGIAQPTVSPHGVSA
jgi:xanthine dehydrogenase accessory factor